MVEWKDTSSWSQKDTAEDPETPKAWTAKIGNFTLKIHRHIHYPPDVWLVSCQPGVMSQVELASKDADEAKCQAVAKLQVICEEAVQAILSW